MSSISDETYHLGEFEPRPDDDVVICRCEEITRGEIRRAVHAGMYTMNEVKRFLRAGMGLCQGQSCNKTVRAIIAQELGISPTETDVITARSPVRPVPMGVYVQTDFSAALEEMKQVAEQGKQSTKDLTAKYGRAARLGERSRGVLDAGATSCCILLQAMADGMKSVLEN